MKKLRKRGFNYLPLLSLYFSSYAEYENQPIKLVIFDDITEGFYLSDIEDKIVGNEIPFINGTAINMFDYLRVKTYVIPKLETKITNETKIYCENLGLSGIFPNRPDKVNLDEFKNEDIILDKSMCGILIPSFGETTLNEVFQNNFKYRLNLNTGIYEPLSREDYIKVFMRRKIRRRISQISEDIDIIADIGQALYEYFTLNNIHTPRIDKFLEIQGKIKQEIAELVKDE